MEWLLSAGSVDKWMLWQIKGFREQIHKLKILKGLKKSQYPATSPSDRQITLDPGLFDKRLNTTLTPPVCYLPKNSPKEKHFPSIYQQSASTSHRLWPFPIGHEHWNNSLLPSYTKMHMKAWRKHLVPKPCSDNISTPKTLTGRIMQKKWWTSTCANKTISVLWKKCLLSDGRASVPAVLWAQGSKLDLRLLRVVLIASPPKSAACSNCVFWPSEKSGDPAGL